MQAFEAKTCRCALGDNGDPCTSTIKIVDILDCRTNLPELSSIELDLVILGMIHCAINCDQVRDSGRAEKTRQRTRMPFYFQSHRICLKTFLFMHRLHKTGFYSLVKHYRVSWLSLPTNVNKSWRLPSSAFSTETIKRVVKFDMNVAEDPTWQAFPRPGRASGFKRIAVKLLPTFITKLAFGKLPRYVETSKASVQCHISTSTPSTADAPVQNDHYDVTTELRQQILNLSEVVKQLTALKCLHQHEPGTASLPLFDDDSDLPKLDSEADASLMSFKSSPPCPDLSGNSHIQ